MRPVVSILGPPGPTGNARLLAAGERLVFGACLCGRCGFDLTVRIGRAGPPAGRVSAYPDHWRLDNLGIPALTVLDPERPQNLITVASGRIGLVIPFELAQIHDGEQLLVTVFGPEPRTLPRVGAGCPAIDLASSRDILDPTSVHFAVLAALCEPRLRPRQGTLRPGVLPALPTSPEISQALARDGLVVTSRAVDAHIEYLIKKLGLGALDPLPRPRRAWRKEILAAAALRWQLVRPEHIVGGRVQPAADHVQPAAARANSA